MWMALKEGTFTVSPSGEVSVVDRQVAEHRLGDILGALGPDIDDLIVPLAVGDQTLGILLLDLLDLLDGLVDPLFLGLGDDHVVEADGDAGQGGETVAGLLEPVGQNHRLLVAGETEGGVDELADLFLGHDLVDVFKGNRLGNHVAQQHPADGGFHHSGSPPSAVDHAHLDLGLQIGLAGIVGDAHLVPGGEDFPFALDESPIAGHVIDPQNHVLGWDDDRLAVGRARGCCWSTSSAPAPRSGSRWRAADAPPSGRRRSRR